MKFKKWIKYLDTAGIKCNIYISYTQQGENKADLIYAGSMYDIPYWLVEYEIDEPELGAEPIYYTHGLKTHIDNDNKEENKDCNGFIIYLKERE